MAIDERARHELFLTLEQQLGPEAAETMMELLPPVGWADVATKEDLRHLEERIGSRTESLRTELHWRIDASESRLRGDMHQMRGDLLRAMNDQFRHLVVLCSTLVLSVAGIAFAAARFT